MCFAHSYFVFWNSLYVYGAWIFYAYICLPLKIGAAHHEGVHLWRWQVNVQCILLWLSPFLLRHRFSLKPKLTDLALLYGEQHLCTKKGDWTPHLNHNQEAVFNWYLLRKEKKNSFLQENVIVHINYTPELIPCSRVVSHQKMDSIYFSMVFIGFPLLCLPVLWWVSLTITFPQHCNM